MKAYEAVFMIGQAHRENASPRIIGETENPRDAKKGGVAKFGSGSKPKVPFWDGKATLLFCLF